MCGMHIGVLVSMDMCLDSLYHQRYFDVKLCIFVAKTYKMTSDILNTAHDQNNNILASKISSLLYCAVV